MIEHKQKINNFLDDINCPMFIQQYCTPLDIKIFNNLPKEGDLIKFKCEYFSDETTPILTGRINEIFDDGLPGTLLQKIAYNVTLQDGPYKGEIVIISHTDIL